MHQTFPQRGLRLPTQAAPVDRSPAAASGPTRLRGSGGVQAAGLPPLPTNSTVPHTPTVCDGLTGLAYRMCLATQYGISV